MCACVCENERACVDECTVCVTEIMVHCACNFVCVGG